MKASAREDKVLKLLACVCIAQIEGDPLLVAVEHLEQGGDAVCKGRPPVAGVVAAVRVLDLDDIGPEVGENGTRIGTGDAVAQFDHSDSTQRQPIHMPALAVIDICRTLSDRGRSVNETFHETERVSS
jgi:hypothetical protein